MKTNNTETAVELTPDYVRMALGMEVGETIVIPLAHRKNTLTGLNYYTRIKATHAAYRYRTKKNAAGDPAYPTVILERLPDNTPAKGELQPARNKRRITKK